MEERSTVSALGDIITYFTNEFRDRNFVLDGFLDLTKAFDYLSHDTLIAK